MGAQSMTEAERQEFLAGVHVGVLAVERADGPPLAVPVWYGYEAGGTVDILTSASTIKGRLVAAAGRASLCAQQEEPPYRYVSVEGPTEIEHLGDAAREAVEVMAIRYLGEEAGRAFAAESVAGDDIRIRIAPERWFSVDYSKSG